MGHRCGEFRSSFLKKCIVFRNENKCNGKTKGLAIQYIFHDCFENSTEICIQYIFHDCLNLHKGNAHVFPPLAKSGAASIAQMRRVSFEFV